MATRNARNSNAIYKLISMSTWNTINTKMQLVEEYKSIKIQKYNEIVYTMNSITCHIHTKISPISSQHIHI